MADSLKTLLMDQLTDLHDSVVTHLEEHNARDVLGEELDQFRSTGTGKSLVMLALIDDVLRIIEIVLNRKFNPLEPKFAEFAFPFFQSAAKTFARKGLSQYAPFQNLTSATAGTFLEFHAGSGRPFGGHHAPTQWSGLHISTNVAARYANAATLNGYERLFQTLIACLADRIPQTQRDEVRQLVDFITDRLSDVRDQLKSQARHSQADYEALAKERAQLERLRAELAAQETHLKEREQLIQQEWKRFQQERADFEQLRQQWEERLADLPDDTTLDRERLANERETLAIEKAALNHQRQQLEAAQAQWEESRRAKAVSSEQVQKLQQAEARLNADRRKLEEDRAALWQEREEFAAIKEQWLAEHHVEDKEGHVLVDDDSFKAPANDNAAVVTGEDANALLLSAAAAGDALQVQAALKWGADVNHQPPDQGFKTPLHLAAALGHTEVMEALLEAGADADRTDAQSQNPLASAIIHEQPQSVRVLCDRAPESISPAYPLLKRILRDTKSPLLSRQLSVEAIGNLQSRAGDFIPTLLNLLESDARGLGQAAALALAKIDPGAVTAQAIPYLSYILEGPVIKKPSTDPRWVSNLFAARGDLHRIAGQDAQATADYESALNYAASDQRPPLEELLEQSDRQKQPAPT
jgi:ankyrin repeat protein